jgi:hypothetical protein
LPRKYRKTKRRPAPAPEQACRPRAVLLYRSTQPDAAQGERCFTALAEDLAMYGWNVEAMPSGWPDALGGKAGPARQIDKLIHYRPVWQSRQLKTSAPGRLLNAAWTILSWSQLALRAPANRPDVVIIGPQPAYGLLAGLLIRRLSKRIRLAYWCLEMPADAAKAGDAPARKGAAAWLAERATRHAYRAFDLIADTGPAMREWLAGHGLTSRPAEIVPWAQAASDAPVQGDGRLRHALFGGARTGLIYRVMQGEAQDHDRVIALARKLRAFGHIHICITQAATSGQTLAMGLNAGDTNISVAAFTDQEMLEKQLAAADIHILSMKAQSAGTSPDFVQSLALGRPTLMAGPQASDTSRWIDAFGVGWDPAQDGMDEVAERLARHGEAQGETEAMRAACHALYQARFSRVSATATWQAELAGLAGRGWFERSPFPDDIFMHKAHLRRVEAQKRSL